MTTVTWSVDSTEWDIATGGVHTVNWRASATDGTYHSGAYGTLSLSPDPDSDTFVPLEDLDEETVIEWVRGAMEEFDAVEAGLINNIAKQANPVAAKGLPWSQ